MGAVDTTSDRIMSAWITLIERHKAEQEQFWVDREQGLTDVEIHNLHVWCGRRASEILPPYDGARRLNYEY
jgi:hypothetical protein